jgi:dihydrofolate reductase
MGKLVVTEFVSLDGVMEDPADWSFDVSRGDGGDRFKFDETFASEALLLGRVTYENFAQAWPSRKGEFADRFNSMPKYVVSSTLENPTWTNTTVLRGDAVDEVRRLKQELKGEIVVHGSARLAQTLIEQDLVDEIRLMVYPVLLGRGKRLFGAGEKKRLKLVDSRVVGDGVAIMIYERASGSFGGDTYRELGKFLQTTRTNPVSSQTTDQSSAKAAESP